MSDDKRTLTALSGFAAIICTVLALTMCIDVEIDPICVTLDLTQAQDLACIEGNRNQCYCPNEDSNVQTQCDLFELPDRAPPKPTCEGG